MKVSYRRLASSRIALISYYSRCECMYPNPERKQDFHMQLGILKKKKNIYLSRAHSIRKSTTNELLVNVILFYIAYGATTFPVSNKHL